MAKNREILDKLKAFGMTNQMISEDLSAISKRYSIDLGQGVIGSKRINNDYYLQFDANIKAEAATMSAHYELFYCLERSIRVLVAETLEAASGDEWWNSNRIPAALKGDVAGRIQREIDSAMTRRSTEELDYTTFGELSVIITTNWDLFGSPLQSRKAVEKVMSNLNSLRGPIAHCSPLAEDEIVRLQLTVRDWFRLME